MNIVTKVTEGEFEQNFSLETGELISQTFFSDMYSRYYINDRKIDTIDLTEEELTKIKTFDAPFNNEEK